MNPPQTRKMHVVMSMDLQKIPQFGILLVVENPEIAIRNVEKIADVNRGRVIVQ